MDISRHGWYSLYQSRPAYPAGTAGAGVLVEPTNKRTRSMRRQVIYENGVNHCFGCGPTNASGLRLSFIETDDGVEVEYTVPAHLQGASGIVHGGIQATLLDETLCMTAYAKAGAPVFTGELTVRYLRPVPTVTPLRVHGRIVEAKSKGWIIEGAITLAGSAEELTRARGRFFAQQQASN